MGRRVRPRLSEQVHEHDALPFLGERGRAPGVAARAAAAAAPHPSHARVRVARQHLAVVRVRVRVRWG